jgi:hypothetical protein
LYILHKIYSFTAIFLKKPVFYAYAASSSGKDPFGDATLSKREVQALYYKQILRQKPNPVGAGVPDCPFQT